MEMVTNLRMLIMKKYRQMELILVPKYVLTCQ
ncbi:hypothetical protein J2W91_002760 [Paenibacillus amylolyticus]|uniref:Uncharacterized protein n=1 Tax=Paenibacillus amylolyticus TaxID=1451 RepID=A0AAP5H1W0_PAEAM|nr:hypothetical protein [Paenibacillus amylolyticus]